MDLMLVKKIESAGGGVAKAARTDLESKLSKSVVTKDNVLKYEYFIEDKNKKQLINIGFIKLLPTYLKYGIIFNRKEVKK